MLIDLCQSIAGFSAVSLNFLSTLLSFLLVTFGFFYFLELSAIGSDCIKTCPVKVILFNQLVNTALVKLPRVWLNSIQVRFIDTISLLTSAFALVRLSVTEVK